MSAIGGGAGLAALAAVASMGTPAVAAGTLPTLALTMTGKTITAPASVPAGAYNVVSTVSGEAVGSPTLVKLAPGVTFPEAFSQVASHGGDPNALQGYASITFNPEAPKGVSSAQTVLTPGNWVALDSESNNPAKWPVTQFTVTANSAPAALPGAQATIKAEEFRFTGPAKLHRGEMLRVEDAGYLVHMIIALPVKNAAKAKALSVVLRAGLDKKAQKLVSGPPVQFLGSVSPGAVQQAAITARPGYYVLACFMDTQDGREHTRLGMVKTVRITK